jgi:hypothetical protein
MYWRAASTVVALLAGGLEVSRPPVPSLAPSLVATPRATSEPSLPPSALAVHQGGVWREWWHSSRAPSRWDGPLPAIAGAVAWRTAVPGLDWGELRLAGTGEAWRLRVILVRVDPARVRLQLHAVVGTDGRAGPWSTGAAPSEALLALNAGQFNDGGPWGWVVHRGRERRPPGTGPLAPAVVVDSAGQVRFVPPDSIAVLRQSGEVVEGFQSYPALLVGDGEVPLPVREPGRGVDLAHRDGRLSIGQLRDGKVLIALTRFEGLGGALSALPFGPTVPEMAALMGALGCRRAVLLDGGISSQLLLRDGGEELGSWRGLRKVPLGLIALPREAMRNEY